MTPIATEPSLHAAAPAEMLPWEGYGRVLKPIDLIFASYMALLAAMALGAWLLGQANAAAFLVFAGFYVVNAAFSAVSRRSADRVRVGHVRILAGALLAPAAYLLAGDPFMRWWPAFLIMCLGGTVLLTLHTGRARVARPLTAHYLGLYVAAEWLAPPPHDWYMVAMNAGAIGFVALLFGEIVAFLGATLASEREQRAQLAAEKARAETMLQKEAADALRASEERFRTLVEISADPVAVVDALGIFRYASPAYERQLGHAPEKLVGQPYRPLIHPEDFEGMAGVYERLRRDPDHPVRFDYRIRDRSGAWHSVEGSAKLSPGGDVVVYSHDVTERKRSEAALRAIVEGTANHTGSDFFQSLVRHLAKALEVRYAFVAEVRDGHARTIAVWSDEAQGENLAYPLAGSPCANVIENRRLCHYPQGVRQLFPQDAILAHLGVESYMGFPLVGASGEALGHLVVMDDRPMSDEAHRAEILQIFAARAGAELERQQADARLRESEAHYRSLFENAFDVTAIVDGEGNFRYVSANYERELGWTPAELIGEPFMPLVHPDDLGEVMQDLQSAFAAPGQVVSAELRARHRDGTWRWFEYLGKARPDGTLVASSRNITERKQAEEKLRANEAHLQLMLENAFDFTSVMAMDGTYRSVSPNYEKEMGWSLGDLIGRPFLELIHPDDSSWVAPLFQQLLAAPGNSVRAECRVRHKDGGWRWLENVGQMGPDGLIVAKSRDITERKQAEEELRKVNIELERRVQKRTAALEKSLAESKRLAAIIEATSDYVGIADLEGRSVYVNRAGRRMVGLDESQTKHGQLVADCYPPHAAEKVRDMLATALAGEVWSGEITLRNTSGREIPVSEVTFALPGADGRTEHLATIIRDISEQKRAEERIRESEEKFRSLTELSSDWYWEQDAEFRFTSFAGGGLNSTGVDHRSLVGKTRWELNYDGVSEKEWARHKALLSEHLEFRDFVMQRLDQDGRARYLSVSGTPIFDASGNFKGYRGIGREITARMEVEKELERQLALFRALIDTMPASIAYKDRNRRYLGCNRAHEEFFGLSPERLAGTTAGDQDYLYPGLKDRIVADEIEVLASGRTIQRHYDFRDRHGAVRPVMHWKAPITTRDGTHIGLLGVFVDISEQKRTEKELQRAKEAAEAALAESRRLTAILEATSDFVGIADASGRVLYVNRAGKRMIGLDPAADERGLDFPRLFSSQQIATIFERGVPTALRDGAWHEEIEFRHTDGHPVPTSFVGIVHKGADGSPELLSCIARDISDRRRIETELRRAKDAAESANRAKSSFLATMSHEIRTPMNAVIGMTSLLLETPLSMRQREFVETVRTSGEALLTVINDILDFSKIEADKLELVAKPFDLREAVEAALDLLAPKAGEKGLDLGYEIEDGVPEGLLGDVTRLRQILVNLLGNALKFTERGEVFVNVRARRPEPAARAVELHISVRDTGVGIRPERMDRLFQSFSQLDASTTREYGGTGLGLAISKRLTELMGGRIWVESEGVPGHGATFHFTVSVEEAETPARARRNAPLPALRGRRLLVVDDNATNRRILTLQAQSWGMHVTEAASPGEALAKAHSGASFDLAILDMHMPDRAAATTTGREGVALARALCELRGAGNLPLVMLTSVGDGPHPEAEAVACFAAYLSKPVKPSQLHDVLLEVLAGASEHAQGSEVPLPEAQLAELLPLRILLAEDVLVNQRFALLALERIGYRADVAANGLEVLAALERQYYDVVLMDVQMPELDGLEATRRIRRGRAAGPQPQIIAMTANAMQGDREMCLNAGMDDYISKPVYLEELRAALERAGARLCTACPAVPAKVAPVDGRMLAELRQRPDAAELVSLYLSDAQQQLDRLRRAALQGDAKSLAQAAHALKSASGYVGAHRLVELAQVLERQGSGGVLEGVRTLVAQLEGEFENVKSALELQGEPA